MNKQKIIWALAVANVALGASLAWRGIAANTAHAQAAAANQPGPGKYTMIPGRSTLGMSIVYFLDTANKRIGGVAPDARDTLEAMPTIALEPVFRAAAAGAGGPAVNPDNPRPQNPTPVTPRRR